MSLKIRLSKLESCLGINVTFEDVLRVLHDQKKGIACDAEWQRIRSSGTGREILYLMEKDID